MSIRDSAGPRLLRSVNPPLGSYFRVGRNHHSLQALIAENRASFSGLVFDAHDHARHDELRRTATATLETVLDTKAFELSTDRGAADKRLAALPWAGETLPHTPASLRRGGGLRLAEQIADTVESDGYSAVLSPTHLLRTARDEWLDVDIELAHALRDALDRRGLSAVTIYFPLTLHSKLFQSNAGRLLIMTKLAHAPIDALWLRVHPFSASNAGPLKMRQYVDGARDLQRLGLPLVGERTGTAGVALLAFGSVGGIESGVTFGERFDVNDLFKAPDPNAKPFAPPPRVYLPSLGVFVSRAQATALFAKPGMRATFACRDTSCCARGPADTDRDPRRHFLLQRQREVNEISRRPEPLRASAYLEEFLRPATDLALRAARVDASFEPTRKRLEGWRLTLGAINAQGPPAAAALVPEGKRTHPTMRKSA